MKFLRHALIGIFIVVIFSPIFSMLFGVFQKSDLKENRAFTLMPPLYMDLNIIKKFPHKFESFYNDHFGFRGEAIQLFQKFKLYFFNKSPVLSVILAKDQWLFYAGANILDNYRGLKYYSPLELRAWKDSYVKKRDWLEKRGIVYLVVIVPEKSTIYPEHLPSDFTKVNLSTTDQLVHYLQKKQSYSNILNLRESLLDAKKKFQPYFRTDTHWNNMGAFDGYHSILNKLNQLHPNLVLKPFDSSRFKLGYKSNHAGDLSYMIGAQNFINEDDVRFTPAFSICAKLKVEAESRLVRDGIKPLFFECPERKLKLVMFHDSFATALIPFISEHFQRSLYILNDIRDLTYLEKTVDVENPDIIIEEVAERNIGKIRMIVDAL
jgi:alginate O-acetyltransferase complex protein AlgJ